MKGLEAAIRKALKGPGGTDPRQRERIYESARRALANGLEKQGLTATDRAGAQNRSLEKLISAIESEYWAAPPPPDLGFPADSGVPGRPPAGQPAARPAAKPRPARVQSAPAAPELGGEIRDGTPGTRASPARDVPPPARAQRKPSAPEPRDPPRREPGTRGPVPREPQMLDPQRLDPHLLDPPGSLDSDPLMREPSVHSTARRDTDMRDPQLRDTGLREPMRAQPPPRGRSAKRVESTPLTEHLNADFGAGDGGGKARRGMGEARPGKKRRPIFSLILVIALVVAFVGIGVVWVIVGDVLQTPAQRDTSVPNPPATINSEDFAGLPSPDGAFSGDWIDVFSPQDLSRVAGRNAARIDLVETDGRDALRVVSTGGDADGEVLFELGPGILQSLAGRKSMVAMTMRSVTEAPTQIYVRCQLPGNGDCGRYRFDVTYEAGDVIFSLDLAGSGGGAQPGYLAINGDVTGAGNGVDIYGIRIRPQ